MASLILRTLHTISVLINKKSFLLAHFIIGRAAKMQTHLTGVGVHLPDFPGQPIAVVALSRLRQGHWLPVLHAHAPTQVLLWVWAAAAPLASLRIVPVGASPKKPWFIVTTSNLGKSSLGQPLKPFHGNVAWIIELNSKFPFYFLWPCSRISTPRQSEIRCCIPKRLKKEE